MQIRRCTILLIEPREKLAFSMDSLASGGDGISARIELLALAPHLLSEVVVTAAEVEILNSTLAATWSDFELLAERRGAPVLSALVKKGLLISDAEADAHIRLRDETLKETHWHAHAAVAHYLGRWHGVNSQEATENANLCTMAELVERLGAPPSHQPERAPAEARIPLIAPDPTPVDELLSKRVTCRNFDATRKVDKSTFSHLLKRVFGAQAAYEIHPGNVVIKRTSPSGGGLHPTGAYLLVQRVEGVASGLYHYHSVEHALEPLAAPPKEVLGALARVAVSEQKYFSNAAVLVVMVSRFGRVFWKYRNHSKAYRVAVLDVGHLSQTLYLTATEFGLGAFVTAAMNEVDVEEAFGIDPLVESPIAVAGFGHRGKACETFEFDPNREVWPDGVAPPK